MLDLRRKKSRKVIGEGQFGRKSSIYLRFLFIRGKKSSYSIVSITERNKLNLFDLWHPMTNMQNIKVGSSIRIMLSF